MSAAFANAINRLNGTVLAKLAGSEVITFAGQPVSAIFDNSFAVGSVGVMGMATSQPVLNLRTVDVGADPVGQIVQVDAATYLVAAHEPDGNGMSRLLLEVSV
jgi:hypothetical protein